jgi:FkbM family methyltransferase
LSPACAALKGGATLSIQLLDTTLAFTALPVSQAGLETLPGMTRRMTLPPQVAKASQHGESTRSSRGSWMSGIASIFKIILVERRMPGRCIQLYYSLLNSFGIRFAVIKWNNGFKIKGYTNCLYLFYEIWSKKNYDIPGFALTPKMVVIDIGANQGFFSLYAASKGATVYAFEPGAENLEVLKWNVSKNALGDQVKVFNTAISSKVGQVPFFVGIDASQEIRSTTGSICNANRGGKEVQSRSVESVTLDSVFHDLHIEKCDFLKIDCEGAEYEILSSTSPDSFRKIARISMECHSYRLPEAASILKNAGFKIVYEESGEAAMLKAVNTQ